MALADFVEEISDDFHSTFTVLNDNTFMNLLGFENDFKNLTAIIKKYIPDAKVKFHNTEPGLSYGIHIIEVTT